MGRRFQCSLGADRPVSSGGAGRLAVFGGTGSSLGEVQSTGSMAQTPWIVSDGAPVAVAVGLLRTGNSAASLRTYWERDGTGAAEGFVREPIPMSAVSVPR